MLGQPAIHGPIMSANIDGRQCRRYFCRPTLTLTADIVGSCVTATDKRRIFGKKTLHCNALSFVDRQCGLVCRGIRQRRPTNLNFNCYLFVIFCSFLSKAVAFCREISHIIVVRRAIQSPIQHDRFLLRQFFSASKHANDSDKSRFFAEILHFFLYFLYTQ